MRDLLVEYAKKLKLGREFLEDFEDIPFTTKEEYLLKVFETAVGYQRINRKNRLLKQAKFEVYKSLEGYDLSNIQMPETLNLEGLEAGEFIDRKENLIFYGPVGTGKTHLATAIGIEACNRGRKVRFFKVSTLVNELIEAYEKGELRRYTNSLNKYDMLICDEWGYIPISLKGAELLFQVIADCYERKSLIITTNLEFGKWISIFMDKKLTSAIIDRVIHHGHIIYFTGDSYRIKNSTINSV
ncbi:MAG: IS21-like element helper ATPase IstB [Cetobacterium sp.]